MVESWEGSLWAQAVGFLIFFLACMTDIYDGHLARKYGAVSRFGRLMDPIADKVLVASVLIVFVESPFLNVPAWPVALIIAREFAVTGLRLLAAAEGVTISAEAGGKMKTIVQMVCLHLILIIAMFDNAVKQARMPDAVAAYLRHAHIGSSVLIYLVTFITVYSGFQYLVHNYRYIVESGDKT